MVNRTTIPGFPLNRHNAMAGRYAQACVEAAGQCGVEVLDLWTLMQKDGQVGTGRRWPRWPWIPLDRSAGLKAIWEKMFFLLKWLLLNELSHSLQISDCLHAYPVCIHKHIPMSSDLVSIPWFPGLHGVPVWRAAPLWKGEPVCVWASVGSAGGPLGHPALPPALLGGCGHAGPWEQPALWLENLEDPVCSVTRSPKTSSLLWLAWKTQDLNMELK